MTPLQSALAQSRPVEVLARQDLDVAGRDNALNLSDGPLIGRVRSLDRDGVIVEVTDPSLAASVTLSDLVAFGSAREYQIGVVDNVSVRTGSGAGEGPVELRVMPVGAFQASETNGTGRFMRGAFVYPHISGACYLIEGSRLRDFLASLTEDVPPSQRLVLGRYAAEHDIPAIADGNRLFQRHVAVLGSTGTGKSWAIASLLERAAHLPNANMVVFDLHGEYGALTEPAHGREPLARGLRVAGPLDLGQDSDEILYLPYWLLQRDELLSLVLDPADPHASDQREAITERIQGLKQASLYATGNYEEATTLNVDSPIPYDLSELIDMLRRDDEEKIIRQPSGRVDPGPYAGRLTGLISRLEARRRNRRFGFIFDPPAHTLSHDWLYDTASTLLGTGKGQRGIKIIDLSEVPSIVLPIVAGVLARVVYDVQFWMDAAQRTPVCLVCDEAHIYMPVSESRPAYRQGLETFETIAKEGRKYGVALLVVSQRPTDVSQTILSQCNNFIIMRLTNERDRQIVERMMPEALGGVAGMLPALNVGEAIIIGDAVLLPNPLRFDPPEIKPTSATQPYWSLWMREPSHPDAISRAVNALRNQMRSA